MDSEQSSSTTIMMHDGHNSSRSTKATVQLNHAGASPSPYEVNHRIQQHLHLEERVGGYAAQDQVSIDHHQTSFSSSSSSSPPPISSLPAVYNAISKLIHAQSSDNIALVESATVGWTRAFYSMVQHHHKHHLSMKKKMQKEEQKIIHSVDTEVDSDDNTDQPNVILISEAEYAANVVAACQWARDHHEDWTVLVLPSSVQVTNGNGNGADTEGSKSCSSSGIVDLSVLDSMLAGTYKYNRKKKRTDEGQVQEHEDDHEILLDPSKIAVVAITHVPTNSGIANPVEEIGERIAKFNNRQRQLKQQHHQAHEGVSKILYLVDACQSVGQIDVSVERIKCHGLVAMGRKYIRGPRGTGFLYLHQDVVDDLIPSHIDHFGFPVTRVPLLPQQLFTFTDTANPIGREALTTMKMMPAEDVLEFAPRHGARRFEFWESNIAARLGLGEAVRYALSKGMSNIESEIKELAAFLHQRLTRIPKVQIHHQYSSTCGIVTFQCLEIESKVVKQELSCNGYEVSVVPATSTPFDSSRTRVPDLVRASVSYTNTKTELDDFCSCLDRIVQSLTLS